MSVMVHLARLKLRESVVHIWPTETFGLSSCWIRGSRMATSERGVWDQDYLEGNSRQAGSTLVRRVVATTALKAVRDDWDDDENDEDGETEQEHDGSSNTGIDTAPTPCHPGMEEGEDNSKIWEEANKKAPMPELIVSPASTSQSLPPPPSAALQPTLRILKRPCPNNTAANNSAMTSSASSTNLGGTSPALRGTLAEREAQYQEARSRIFGGERKEKGCSISRTSSGGPVVVRDPLGPSPSESEGNGDRPARGFGERRREKK